MGVHQRQDPAFLSASIGYQQIIELKMISGTFFVLLTTGLLSVVMALPLHSITYYQDEAGKQGHTAYFPNYYQGMLTDYS